MSWILSEQKIPALQKVIIIKGVNQIIPQVTSKHTIPYSSKSTKGLEIKVKV